MIIIFKKSFGGIGITINNNGKDFPKIFVGKKELIEGEDYILKETEKREINQIVFEWMENQTVYFNY